MLDQELWRFVNSFAPWLSAIGTIAAVVTSLYLARKDTRIDLRVTAGVQVIVIEGARAGQGVEVVSLDVTNFGRRAATVNSLYWKTGILRRKKYVWIPPRNLFSTRVFPVKLTDGEQATFNSPISEFEANLDQRAKVALSGRASRLKAHCVGVGVGTSTGEHFESRVEKGLRE